MASPDGQVMYSDVLALQFVLGRTFAFNVLHGVSPNGEVLALSAGEHGRTLHSASASPVPMVKEPLCWAAELFTAISKADAAKPDARFHIPLSYYVHATSCHYVEHRYLNLHVALEAFSFWILGGKDRKASQTVDTEKWLDFLSKNAPALRGLAVTGREDALMSNLRNQAYPIPPSSRVVKDAFKAFGLSLATAMKKELPHRNVIAHTALMFAEPQEDVEQYGVRIAIVRTMLVALLAKVVGYKGAIMGWKKRPGRDFDPAPEEWWPVDPNSHTLARLLYVAEPPRRRG